MDLETLYLDWAFISLFIKCSATKSRRWDNKRSMRRDGFRWNFMPCDTLQLLVRKFPREMNDSPKVLLWESRDSLGLTPAKIFHKPLFSSSVYSHLPHLDLSFIHTYVYVHLSKCPIIFSAFILLGWDGLTDHHFTPFIWASFVAKILFKLRPLPWHGS